MLTLRYTPDLDIALLDYYLELDSIELAVFLAVLTNCKSRF